MGFHLEKGPPAPPASQKRNELPRRACKGKHFPTCWAESPKLTPEAQLSGLEAPWEADDGVPSGELTPATEWKLPAPRRAPEEGGRGPAGPVPAGGRRRRRREGSRRGQQTGCVLQCLVAFAVSRPCVQLGNLGPARRSVWLAGRAARRPLAPCISFTAPGSAAGQRRG